MTESCLNPLAELVWRTRYRFARRDGEAGPAATMARVAGALAAGERDAANWRERFSGILAGYQFLPGGRILAAAGVGSRATLLNCFVMGPLDDSPARLFGALAEGARTMRLGGGAGWDFSSLRPRGTSLADGGVAPGPVACLELWNAACRAMTGASVRGGAMMASLSAAHPDIAGFIEAKARAGTLEHFNLSVQISDGFMAAVEADGAWPLRDPAGVGPATASPPARELWRRMLGCMLQWSEPGALFVDTMNRENNLWWRERLTTTNPCGEAPLPPYGACDLGSINLAALVEQPFTPTARIDRDRLAGVAATAVRLLDDVLDVTRYPLARQRREALATRRIGLGITGLGDALAMLGLCYDSEAARDAAASLLEVVKLAAYETSVGLAAEKGAFGAFDRDRYLEGAFVRRLPAALRDRIARDGIRNSHLLAIAPTGSVSLLAGNVSPGIEPIPALRQRRRIRDGEVWREVVAEDWAWSLPGRAAGGLGAFVEAAEVSPEAQLSMQAALQPQVDGAISKTLLLPAGTDIERLGALFVRAHREGLKGLAAHRIGSARGSVVIPGCAAGQRGGAECEPG